MPPSKQKKAEPTTKTGLRVCVLTTGTNNTQLMYQPLASLGHDLTIITYDAMTYAEHENLPDLVASANPDFVLLIGAIVEHHGAPVPNTQVLARIGAKHKLINLCSDGAESAWWEQLVDYYENGRFACQVNIDGVRVGPIADRGLTTILPVDISKYIDAPWGNRHTWCGFSGTMHGNRHNDVHELVKRDALVYRPRDLNDISGDYKRFIESCRMGLNFAATGGNTGSMHVKHRAAGELPAAGCLVLETYGSPLGDWYRAGTDYLEYKDLDDAVRQINWVRTHGAEAWQMAQRMRATAIREHSPEVFWSQVLERIGIGKALLPVREVPYRTWSMSTVPPRRPRSDIPGRSASAPIYVEPVYVPPPASPTPQSLGAFRRINLVGMNGGVYAIPQALGPIDITTLDLVKYPQIRRYPDVPTAQRALMSLR